MTEAGKVRTCANCHRPVDAPVAVIVSTVVPPHPEVKPRARNVAVTKPESRERPLTTRSIVALAKREAAELRRSIAAHERALRRERERLSQITRLLDAAAESPRAVVRPIRTTA
jgi:hypothetical protein